MPTPFKCNITESKVCNVSESNSCILSTLYGCPGLIHTKERQVDSVGKAQRILQNIDFIKKLNLFAIFTKRTVSLVVQGEIVRSNCTEITFTASTS